jgi:hypothetical protein
MMAWAATVPQPVISSSRATAGSTAASGAVPASGPVLPSASMPCAADRLDQLAGVALPAMSTSVVARTRKVSTLEATVKILISARSSSFSSRPQYRIRSCARSAQPGELPQPPDLRRRDEAGPQHAPLGQLGQPHRILPIGFAPARHVLHRPRVDQLHLYPRSLQHHPPDTPVGSV